MYIFNINVELAFTISVQLKYNFAFIINILLTMSYIEIMCCLFLNFEALLNIIIDFFMSVHKYKKKNLRRLTLFCHKKLEYEFRTIRMFGITA